jgi:hypothetical protein
MDCNYLFYDTRTGRCTHPLVMRLALHGASKCSPLRDVALHGTSKCTPLRDVALPSSRCTSGKLFHTCVVGAKQARYCAWERMAGDALLQQMVLTMQACTRGPAWWGIQVAELPRGRPSGGAPHILSNVQACAACRT